jgi:hypothetical protein
MVTIKQFRNGDVLWVGAELQYPTITYELSKLPTINFLLPIQALEHIDKPVEISWSDGDYSFCGLISEYEIDKKLETVNVTADHILKEWDYQTIPVNTTVKQRSLTSIFSDPIFIRDLWDITFLDNASSELVEYTYANQTKLQALSDTMNMTKDYFWRVARCGCRDLEIGKFGEQKEYLLGNVEPSEASIKLLNDITITKDFNDVINVAKAFSGNASNGMAQMTLREVYNRPDLWDPMFPIRQVASAPNTDYTYNEPDQPRIAPNNDFEYEVVDLQGVSDMNGIEKNGSYQANDHYPIPARDEAVTDDDRLWASIQLYKRCIKWLKRRRIRFYIEVDTSKLPCDLNVGDKILLSYTNDIVESLDCSKEVKNILKLNQYMNIIAITDNQDTSNLKLDVYLKEDFYA